MTNKVSIVATVRNEAKDIGRLIDSILHQNYPFHEIVINDNGSCDGTVAVIKKYIEQYGSRIKLIESGPLSIGKGRNAAIAGSSGEIIALIDCGCYPGPDWLAQVVQPLLADEKLDLVWGNVIYDTRSRVIPSTELAQVLVFLTKFPENRQNGENLPSTAFRRRVWEQFGRFPEIRFPIEDLLTIDLLNKSGLAAVHVPAAKVYYYRYPQDLKQVYQKWVISATSAFFVRKSQSGFWRQLLLFSGFYLFVGLLFLNPLIGISLLFCYMFMFLAIKFHNNRELGREIIGSPQKLFLALAVLVILNVARSTGVLQACWLVLSGQKPAIKYYGRIENEKT